MKSEKTINLFPLNRQIIFGIVLMVLISLILQNIYLGIILGLVMSFFLSMVYAAKLIMSNDRICISFFLRPWTEPNCYSYHEVEEIVFHEQQSAGGSDVIEISTGNGNKSRFHVSFNKKNLEETLSYLDGKVKIVLPKLQQPPKYR